MNKIKILIIIILILIIIFCIKIFNTNILNKEKMSIDDVKKIIEKYNNINNYEIKYNNLNGENIKRVKDDIQIYEHENMIIWTDFKNNKEKIIDKEKKVAIIKNKSTATSFKEKMENLLKEINEYDYKKEEKYNGYNCIIIEKEEILNYNTNVFYFEDEKEEIEKLQGEKLKIRLWIDKETGFIIKEETELKKEKRTEEYEVKFNCVNDDIKNIDLTGYNIIEPES